MSGSALRKRLSNPSQAIKRTAWKQIGAEGAAALSLRAIARRLRITAPAIYNHFPSRDDLVTALIIDALMDFGASQWAALEAAPPDDPIVQLMSIGFAYREWALAHPERYQLLFESPIPGYVPPRDQTMPASAKSLKALLSVLQALRDEGRLVVRHALTVPPDRLEAFRRFSLDGSRVNVETFAVAMLIWSRVHGLVSLEISGRMPPLGPTGETLYRYELMALVEDFTR